MLLAVVLLLAPLAGFWPTASLQAALEIMTLAALCCWLWTTAHYKRSLWLPPGTHALLLLLAWGALQLIPLPPFLVKVLSPHAWQIYQQSVEVLSPSAWLPLSLHPKSTLQVLITLCAACSVYFLTVFLQTDRLRLKQSVLWLAGIGGGLSIGVIVWRLVKVIFTTKTSADQNMAALAGPDLSSVALLLLLLGPLALAALLAFRPTARYGSFEERIVAFWQATVREHFFIVLLSAVVIPFGLAFLYWQSLFFYFAALVLLWLLLTVKKKGRREATFFVLFMALVIPAMFIGLYSANMWTNPPRQALLIAADQPLVERLTKDYFLTGAGFGTYADIFRRYDHRPAVQQLPIDKISLLARGRTAGGGVCVILGFWFVVAVLRHSFSHWRSRRNKLAIYLFAGSFCGLFALAAMIAVMGQELPAWLWYYGFAIVGLMVASSQVSSRESAEDEFAPVDSDWRRIFGCVLATGLVAVAVYFHGSTGLAKGLYRQIKISPTSSSQTVVDKGEQHRILSHVIFHDPLQASYRWALGWNLVELGLTDEAMSCFASALRLEPLAGAEIYRLGIYMLQTDHEQKAIKLLQHGLQNDWNHQGLQIDYVTRLLRSERKREALDHIRQILAAAPSRTSAWLQFLDQHNLPATQGASILADHPRCLLDYGDFLLQKGEPDLAATNYSAALYLIQTDDVFDQKIVWRLVDFFESQQQYEEALAAVLAGIRVYPENLDFMKASGRLYKHLGLTYKALEIYRQILMHSPQDQEIRHRLLELESLRH